jgi:chromosome segregation ATPase
MARLSEEQRQALRALVETYEPGACKATLLQVLDDLADAETALQEAQAERDALQQQLLTLGKQLLTQETLTQTLVAVTQERDALQQQVAALKDDLQSVEHVANTQGEVIAEYEQQVAALREAMQNAYGYLERNIDTAYHPISSNAYHGMKSAMVALKQALNPG